MKKKTILITGASKGIGRSIAIEMAKPGINLILTWNSDKKGIEKTTRLTNDKGALTEIHQLNLDNGDEVSKFCDSLVSPPDILINNAAIAQKKDFLELSCDDWNRILSANLIAPFQLCKSFIPSMQSKGYGRIVNISSIGGQWGGIHQVHYAASKAGLINLTRSLAKVYSKDGIVTTAVTPGIIDTAMTKDSLGHKIDAELLKEIPTGRLGTSEEVAKAVQYLCSDEASYLSGTTLNINGGVYFNT